VNIGIVVSAQLLFFLRSKGANRLLNIAVGVLAANHETDLTRRIGGDGRVSVFNSREDFFAIFLEFGDQGKVKPLVLGCFDRS
jgi:hypothetical protein